MTSVIDKLQLRAFAVLGIVTIFSVLIAFTTELYYLALIPFAIIVAYVAIINFRFLYFMLLATLPFSIEFSFSSSLATDLPDEPLMVGLMGATLLFLLTKIKSLPRGFFLHPLFLALGFHLFWIFICIFTSINGLVSLKVFLSKIWYVTTFSVLTVIIIRTKEDLKTAFWCIYIPLTLLIIQVLVRHSLQGFSFYEINKPMMPFFRNHVNYAAIVTVFFPLVWYARGWYEEGTTKRRLLNFSVVLYLAAVYFSYTRTCYIALLLIPPFIFAVRNKLMLPVLCAVAVGAAGLVYYLEHNNKFLDYAPDYSTTIIHDDFNSHLSSTLEGKDVSSMERVYRWVAISRMWKDNPVFGFGPGNFYPTYKKYTLSAFRTYVSDNPERSTAHNYFLLLLAEQGATGLAVFVLFTFVIFVWGERIYHRLQGEEKKIALTLLVILAMIYVNLMLSDLLESDKVGPFFFMAIALLASLDLKKNLFEAKR